MYRKILVPLDGSESAEKVLPHVISLARATGAEVVLLRVPIYAYGNGGYYTYSLSHAYRLLPLADDREPALRQSRNYLNKLRNELIRLGTKVTIVVPEGPTVTCILEYAHRPDVDLIAMATDVSSRLHRILFGSMAYEVLRESGKPVLMVRPDQPPIHTQSHTGLSNVTGRD